MINFIIYEIETGKIVADGVSPSQMLAEGAEDPGLQWMQSFVECTGRYYVDLTTYEIVPRDQLDLLVSQSQIVADGLDEALITNIPPGTTIQWPDGQIDEVLDGEVRFSVDLPGTYALKFSSVPYLDQEVTLEAVAAT